MQFSSSCAMTTAWVPSRMLVCVWSTTPEAVPEGIPYGFAALDKWVVMDGWSIHPRYRLERARTGEGSRTRRTPAGGPNARLRNLKVGVSRICQYIPCFSSGMPFNAANGARRYGTEEAKMARFTSAWGGYCSLSCLIPERE